MTSEDLQSPVRRLIQGGIGIAGGAVGGALGFFAGGLESAAALGAASVTVSHVLENLGEEVSNRLLGHREKQRIGGVLAIATNNIRCRLERGERVRSDGFFEKNTYGRSDAEGVAENIILKAQREPEEKKLLHMGYFFSNVAFNTDISAQMAHQIVKSCERMTYRQFCLLKIFGIDQIRNTLRDTDYRGESENLTERRQVLYECFDLARSYYIVEKSYILGVTDICPRNVQTQGLGADIFNHMQLGLIPNDDLMPIIEQLK